MADGFLKEEEKEDQRSYQFSLWWVNHREKVKGAGYMLFLAFDVVLLCFAVWSMTDAFVISYAKERLAVAEMVAYGQTDLNARTVAEAAQPLTWGDGVVFASEGDVADAYAPLTNPNADWWATFDYVFTTTATATAPQHGFILPGEKDKPMLALAAKELSGARATSLTLQNVVWHRVDKHVTGAYAAWSAARLAFTFKDVAFVTNVPFAGKTIGQARFTVTNGSAYNYYNPTFAVLLKRGSAIVGVNQTTLQSLDSGETRDISIDWFGALPAAGDVQIVPSINVFDASMYKPLVGETQLDTRSRIQLPPS